MNRIKRFFKYGPKKTKVGLLVFCAGFAALAYLIYYELVVCSTAAHGGEILFSRICYSILASSIFFFITQYFPVILPRKERKIKIIQNTLHKAVAIDWYLSRIRVKLNVEYGQFSDVDKFRAILDNTNSNQPVDDYTDWYAFLNHIRERIVELTRAITIHSEHLPLDFLEEIMVIEKQLLTPGIYEGPAYINTGNLRWAELQLQEVLVHNGILQELVKREYKKYNADFEFFGIEYRARNYAEYDKLQEKKMRK